MQDLQNKRGIRKNPNLHLAAFSGWKLFALIVHRWQRVAFAGDRGDVQHPPQLRVQLRAARHGVREGQGPAHDVLLDGQGDASSAMSLTPQPPASQLASPGGLSGHSGSGALLPGPGAGLGGLGLPESSPAATPKPDEDEDGDPAESAKLLGSVTITLPEAEVGPEAGPRTPLLDQV